MNGSLAQYPKREEFFSHKFVRLLTNVEAAQEIGSDGTWLLTVIVHQEDKVRYRRPVTFWDDQLARAIGAKSVKTLRSVRLRAVEAGWLHYEAGRKGNIARYWVTIPDHADGLDDAPAHETTSDDRHKCEVKATQQNTGDADSEVNPTSHRARNGRETGLNRIRNGHAFFPNPSPNPIPEERAPKSAVRSPIEVPDLLKELAAAWNALPDGLAARIKKLDSTSVLNGWRRANRDPEVQAAFADLPELMAKIRGSPFLHGKPWFKFGWLFCQGPDRTQWNVLKIIGGNYDKQPISLNQRTTGRHDPARPIADAADF